MDIYAELEKKVYNLRDEIVSEIRSILYKKGYMIGDKCSTPYGDVTFEIEFDRIIINRYHTDNLNVEELLQHLRNAIHVLPKDI